MIISFIRKLCSCHVKFRAICDDGEFKMQWGKIRVPRNVILENKIVKKCNKMK